jgi:hypothetical protein
MKAGCRAARDVGRAATLLAAIEGEADLAQQLQSVEDGQARITRA